MSNIVETPFAKLISTGEYEYYLERGQIVTGRVVGYEKDNVLIDIGAKSEAYLPLREIADYHIEDPASVLPVGNEYEFYIIRDEAANTTEPRIIVSYKRVSQARIWSQLEEIKVQDNVCEAVIQDVVKGGVVVEIDGLRGFIPASHLRVKGGSNNPQLIGETIPCTILEIDRQSNKLILSQKLAISKLYAGEREQLMNELVEALNQYEQGVAEGKDVTPITVTGEVVRITDFGAFIKIDNTEMDGLLPLSEIAWKRLNHPNEALKISDQLTVQVLNVVPEQSRISLSLKRLTPDPWVEVQDQLPVGGVADMTVLRQNSFGVFATTKIGQYTLEDMGFEAFIPFNEMKVANANLQQSEVIASYEIDETYKAALKYIKKEERKMIFATRYFGENGTLDKEALAADIAKEQGEE